MGAMTDLLSRPIRRVDQSRPAPSRPIVLSAAVAAGWSVVVGLVVCIVTSVGAWFAADSGSFGASIRVGGLAWLVGQGAGIDVPGAAIRTVPLGFVAMSGLLLYRGGRWAGAHSAVRSGVDVAVGAVSVAAWYAAAGLVVWALTRTDGAQVPLLRMLLVSAVLGLVSGGAGVLVGSGWGSRLFDALPETVRSSVVGALAAMLVMVVTSGLLLAGSLVVHFSSAMRVAEEMHTGLVGGIVVALVGIAFAPNAMLCAGSYIAGPGFAVGAGSSVAPADVEVGSLPGFPLLAALPREGAGTWWQTCLVALPVVAGAVGGVIAVRRYPVFGLDVAALRGAVAGLAGGVGFAGAAWLATGAVGPGRMQHVGPDVGATLLVCSVAFLLGGAVAALGHRVVTSRRGTG